ncbi:Transcription initiation factor TFIID subunit 8 [Linum grandiflorum]
MSNGGEASTPGGRLKADEFGYAVARKAVAQVCENVGFDGSKESALDALTDVTLRYLRDLGKTASSNANLCGRTECTIFDVVRGFEDIGATQGFPGAYNSSGCLVSSGTIRELVDYVGSNEEIPFAQPVPQFPIVRGSKLIPSFQKMNEAPPGKHVPDWLPALPDQHTYVHTPMWNERDSDPRADKIEQARQRRKAETALLSLQQRLVSNSSGSSGVVRSTVADEQGGVADGNPFLKKPLNPGEKDVSLVSVPNHVSVMEAFAPAIEAAKEVGGVNEEVEEGGKQLLPEKRASVSFSLKTRKKLLGEESLEWKKSQGGRRTGLSLLGKVDERDDKKRRAEYILRQSMENPQEFPQL